MDETRKAASVQQLQELNDAVDARLKAVEAKGRDGDPAQAPLVQVLASRILILEQKCDQMMAKMDEPDEPVDLSPILTTIAQMNDKQMAMLATLVEAIARPLKRTGEAVLPDGGRVQLQVSETRM